LRSFAVRKQSFACSNCGKCCKYLVRLSDKDVARMESAGLSDFWVKDGKKKYLKQKNGVCIYYSYNNGESKCSIYEHRPRICRHFPRVKAFGKECWDARCPEFRVPKWLP